MCGVVEHIIEPAVRSSGCVLCCGQMAMAVCPLTERGGGTVTTPGASEGSRIERAGKTKPFWSRACWLCAIKAASYLSGANQARQVSERMSTCNAGAQQKSQSGVRKVLSHTACLLQ